MSIGVSVTAPIAAIAIRMAELNAGTMDGVTLVVEQFADTAHEQDFVMLIITPVATTLERFKLRKLLLPISQHVRFDAAQLADFTNGEITLGGNRGQWC